MNSVLKIPLSIFLGVGLSLASLVLPASFALSAPHNSVSPSEELLAPPLIGDAADAIAREEAAEAFAQKAKALAERFPVAESTATSRAKSLGISAKAKSLGISAKAKQPETEKTQAKAKHFQNRFQSVDQKPAFDLPVTYNRKVRNWIRYFQTNGQSHFKLWLERSARYEPKILPLLKEKGLPQDLLFLAMIESGFSARATSTASAVGYWQFITATANRYGLKTSWWIDERRDIVKSTVAAASYLNDLYKMFDSWYLAAAAYNMGEGRTKRLIAKYKTRNYWELSKKSDFPRETEEYVPKIIAAMLIAKAPHLYGFHNLKPQKPYEYEVFDVPGGTDLENLAYFAGVDKEILRQLNPELVKGFVPQFIDRHTIRVPKGLLPKANEFVRASL